MITMFNFMLVGEFHRSTLHGTHDNRHRCGCLISCGDRLFTRLYDAHGAPCGSAPREGAETPSTKQQGTNASVQCAGWRGPRRGGAPMKMPATPQARPVPQRTPDDLTPVMPPPALMPARKASFHQWHSRVLALHQLR